MTVCLLHFHQLILMAFGMRLARTSINEMNYIFFPHRIARYLYSRRYCWKTKAKSIYQYTNNQDWPLLHYGCWEDNGSFFEFTYTWQPAYNTHYHRQIRQQPTIQSYPQRKTYNPLMNFWTLTAFIVLLTFGWG